MDKGSSEWLPVFRKSLPTYDRLALAGMEKGVLAFADRALGVTPIPPGQDGLAFVEDVFRNFLYFPHQEQLANLGPLSHGEGWGTSHRLVMLPRLPGNPSPELLREAQCYAPWKRGLPSVP